MIKQTASPEGRNTAAYNPMMKESRSQVNTTQCCYDHKLNQPSPHQENWMQVTNTQSQTASAPRWNSSHSNSYHWCFASYRRFDKRMTTAERTTLHYRGRVMVIRCSSYSTIGILPALSVIKVRPPR